MDIGPISLHCGFLFDVGMGWGQNLWCGCRVYPRHALQICLTLTWGGHCQCCIYLHVHVLHVQCPDKPLLCVRQPPPVVSLSPPLGSGDTGGPSISQHQQHHQNQHQHRQQQGSSKQVQRPRTSPYGIFSKTSSTIILYYASVLVSLLALSFPHP